MKSTTIVIAAVLAAFKSMHGGTELVRSRGFAIHAAAMRRFITRQTGRLGWDAELVFERTMRAALEAK
jgi:hypothetical protein